MELTKKDIKEIRTFLDADCELCGQEWAEGDPDSNWQDTKKMKEEASFIRTHGRCRACLEEWGDQWPDRI